jgi:hypothetical protein
MLEGVEAEISYVRGFRVAINGEHPALLMELIEVQVVIFFMHVAASPNS